VRFIEAASAQFGPAGTMWARRGVLITLNLTDEEKEGIGPVDLAGRNLSLMDAIDSIARAAHVQYRMGSGIVVFERFRQDGLTKE